MLALVLTLFVARENQALRIDDCTMTLVYRVTCLLRMLVWALAVVAPESGT